MPSGRVFVFTDPFPYQAALHAADLAFFPTTKGTFRAELTQIRVKFQLWMQCHHQTLPQVNTGAVYVGRKIIGFLTGPKGQTMRHRGMDVSTADIIVKNSDVFHQRTDADCHYGSMSLTLDDFDAACRAIVGRDSSGTAFEHLVRPSPDLMSRLITLHETVGRITNTTPAILELPEVSRALEQQLIHLMVRCLTEGASSNMTAGGHRHDMIIARFEEYMEANPNTPLYLPEICAALGTAERTLRIACEKRLGMGPIRYLALRRMHLVRRALLRADFTTTVTRVATDHGFWELGRFSVTYRKLFGESPSETLRQPADDRLPAPIVRLSLANYR